VKTNITPLYKTREQKVPLHIKAVVSCIAIFLPYHTLSNPAVHTEPYEQEFIITAYYSPMPGQCCYIKGGIVADKILNGQGIAGADQTPVYPGMIAAPSSYAFGTKVSLPGLGTFEVHDRGGAINELGNGKHRLDIWAGYGEEGLARALAFGLQRVKGTVYPTVSSQPKTYFDLAVLPAPINELRAYFTEKDNFLAMRPKEGERGLSVYLLQDHLKEIGYLKHRPTGFFGPQTSQAFKAFLADYRVDAPKNILSETSAAYVLGARTRLGARDPFADYIDPKASEESIAQAQRVLRFLGYYKGRTNGQYDDNLFSAILKFQQNHGLVGTASDTGAGRIGPLTSRALLALWNRTIVRSHADRYLDLHSINQHVSDRGNRVEQFMGTGYSGNQVRVLQRELAALGFFPDSKINGVYGPLTEASVLRYQLDRKIISSVSDTGAGYVGPSTLRFLRLDQRNILYRLVRAQGWKAL
jgi:peptidoglycan hydrolase-like protein with peptidoglycan-binding domain/3D (Asp-Asp-Asp) domain-containing protein